MADLAASAVTQIAAWCEGSVTGKRYTALHLNAVLATQGAGGSGTKIPSAALGLKFISQVSAFIKSDNSVVIPATPSFDGTQIILGGGTANAAASYSGTFAFVVKGLTSSTNG